MRLMHRLTWLFILIPLLFGWASLKYGIVSIGMGLWLASCWTLVNKLVSEIGGHPLYPYALAEELQLIRNQNQTDSACCDFPLPVWQIESVKCSSCQTVLMERYRPDLGRPRSDGRLEGSVSTSVNRWISGHWKDALCSIKHRTKTNVF